MEYHCPCKISRVYNDRATRSPYITCVMRSRRSERSFTFTDGLPSWAGLPLADISTSTVSSNLVEAPVILLTSTSSQLTPVVKTDNILSFHRIVVEPLHVAGGKRFRQLFVSVCRTISHYKARTIIRSNMYGSLVIHTSKLFTRNLTNTYISA
jgi:hypothetical protein